MVCTILFASTSTRSSRCVQMSPHNNASVTDSSRASSRKFFCGEASRSWPGRSPARLSSFARFEALASGAAGTAGIRRKAKLASCQNFFEARLKVFLPFRPQLHPFDRQSLFDAANPVEKLFDVFAGLLIIVVQIFGARHGFKEKFFLRAFWG